MSQKQTTTVRYLVFCGKPTTDGTTYKHEFLAEAPSSLCTPHTDQEPDPDPDATGVFITSLIERHHDEILRSRSWRCVSCDKPAREILHHALPLLSPNIHSAKADFKPSVLDTAVPICISGGDCDRQAVKMVQNFTKENLPGGAKPDFSDTCDTCGKKSGVRLCSGCKIIAYCSKECQAQSWPLHRKQCKRAQEEAANKGI